MSAMTDTPLRVAIVGAGIRGKLYARALRRSAGVDVIGMCDRSESVAEAASAELSVPVYASHKELLKEGADAVIVATPDFAHVEAAVDAARAGCHLMIEKPLATRVEDAQAIMDAVEVAGTQCMVAFENRWNPAFAALHERVLAGDLGQVMSQTAVLSTTAWVPTEMLGWAAQSSPVWFLMPHTLDLALWLAGGRARRVSAIGSRGRLEAEGVDTWDLVHALVELDNGSIVNLESSWALPEQAPTIVDFRYALAGDQGTAHIDQLNQTLMLAADRVSFPRTLTLEQNGEPRGFPTWMVTDWVYNLIAGTPVAPTAVDGLRATEALQAIDQSLRTGETVELAMPA